MSFQIQIRPSVCFVVLWLTFESVNMTSNEQDAICDIDCRKRQTECGQKDIHWYNLLYLPLGVGRADISL